MAEGHTPEAGPFCHLADTTVCCLLLTGRSSLLPSAPRIPLGESRPPQVLVSHGCRGWTWLHGWAGLRPGPRDGHIPGLGIALVTGMRLGLWLGSCGEDLSSPLALEREQESLEPRRATLSL